MKKYIHYIIALAIMVAFRFIPVGMLPEVTPAGLQVLGIFLGTIYLWTTVDPSTSSLICICMLALSDYAPAGQVIAGWFGNPVVIQMLFIMIFMAGLTNKKLTLYIGRWIITRKFLEGKPWVFTFAILFGTFIMSAFTNAFAPIFLFWPILYSVFEDVGFTKQDKYPKLLIHGVVIAALIGFPVPPYMSNGLALLSNYRGILPNFAALTGIEGVMIADSAYFIGCFTMGVLLILAIVLVMKFIWRPDVTPLKSITVEMINKNPLPPMTKGQKTYGIALVTFIAMMLLPSLFPTAPVLSFLNQNSYAIAVVLVTVMCMIRFEDGPVLTVPNVMAKEFAWPTFWLCSVAIYLGSVLTNEATGITPFLNTILGPLFSNMSGAIFTFVILAVCVVLTNLCNSLVIGMIMQPVILTYCASAGVNPAPIIAIMIFTVLLTASCTPAASPFAAMLFGNKEWLSSGDVYKFSLTIVAIELAIIMIIGIPFMNILIYSIDWNI